MKSVSDSNKPASGREKKNALVPDEATSTAGHTEELSISRTASSTSDAADRLFVAEGIPHVSNKLTDKMREIGSDLVRSGMRDGLSFGEALERLPLVGRRSLTFTPQPTESGSLEVVRASELPVRRC